MSAWKGLGLGPALDVEVATRVMRWPIVTWDAGSAWPSEPHVRKPSWTVALIPHDGRNEWRPSDSLSASWDVLGAMLDRGWSFTLLVDSDHEQGAIAHFNRAGCEGRGIGESVPLAICRAALEALDT